MKSLLITIAALSMCCLSVLSFVIAASTYGFTSIVMALCAMVSFMAAIFMFVKLLEPTNDPVEHASITKAARAAAELHTTKSSNNNIA